MRGWKWSTAICVLTAIEFNSETQNNLNSPLTKIVSKAKKGQNAVLFVVDAETDQFFNDEKKKIVETFESAEYNKGEFQALCIKSERIKKVDLTKEDQAVELLEKAHCVFLVLVKYRVDNVSNAENYEMRINSGVLHPYFEHTAMQILQHDLNDLMHPIQKSKFVKKQTIDVCNATAVSLSIVYALPYLSICILILFSKK